MSRRTAIAIPFSVRVGGPHPSRFGLGRRWLLAAAERIDTGWGEDARLFATTWAVGFFAFSLFLA